LLINKKLKMTAQNFKNHAKMVPGFHYVGLLAILALLIGSFINLCHSAPGNLYSASLICLVAFILAVLWIYIRTFPLKAQDRAIRADENLRYYVLTGKLFPNELTVQQIIALRFAPDSEFVGLVDRAIKENLSNKDIKLAIQNWKADFYRV
jgi:membrane-bound ClpP family serine protease